MCEILGIDNGNTLTKDSNMNVFNSSVSEKEPLGLSKSFIWVDSKKYWIGEGKQDTEICNIESISNKVSTLTCCALADSEAFNLVVGLPINMFHSYADKMKDVVMSYDNSIVNYNDKIEKVIRINDVFVYAQGISALYYNEIDYGIIVDVGSRTTDVACVVLDETGQLVIQHSDTYYCGCMPLYVKVAGALNNEYKNYGINLSSMDAKSIIKNGLYIDGEEKSISFLYDIYKEHFSDLLSGLSMNFPVRTTPKYLVGGGAELLFDILPYNNIEVLPDALFANALGYKEIGKVVFSNA